ncbi:hypothetical protein ACFLXU_03885 [Chloroflexota bacterium]
MGQAGDDWFAAVGVIKVTLRSPQCSEELLPVQPRRRKTLRPLLVRVAAFSYNGLTRTFYKQLSTKVNLDKMEPM